MKKPSKFGHSFIVFIIVEISGGGGGGGVFFVRFHYATNLLTLLMLMAT